MDPVCHQGAKPICPWERLIRSGIVGVVMGSVVHGDLLLVRCQQQREPDTSLTCSFVQAVLDSFIQLNDFVIHFMLLLREAEEQRGDLGSSLQTQDNTTTDSCLEGCGFNDSHFPPSLFLRVGLCPSCVRFLILKEYCPVQGDGCVLKQAVHLLSLMVGLSYGVLLEVNGK